MGVFEAKTLQFLIDLLHPVEMVFSKIRPSQRKDSLIEPPNFFMTWMYDRLVTPFSLRTESTASSAKCCLSWVKSFELKVVLAMLIKSFLNF